MDTLPSLGRDRLFPTLPARCVEGYAVEACIDCTDSLIAALDADVHRIEVCSALALGGLTPSIGLLRTLHTTVQRVRSQFGPQHAPAVVALIRPRPGDFVYDEADIAAMVSEVSFCADAGVEGIAVGCLKPAAGGGFEIDCAAMAPLISAAREEKLSVCFHRAFDLVKDPLKALDVLIRLGVDRVLTSGGGRCAAGERETEVLAQLVARAREAGGKPVIVAAGGVRADNVESIMFKTGVRQVHTSALGNMPVRREWAAAGASAAAAAAGSSRGGRDGPVLGSAGAEAQSQWFAADPRELGAIVRNTASASGKLANRAAKKALMESLLETQPAFMASVVADAAAMAAKAREREEAAAAAAQAAAPAAPAAPARRGKGRAQQPKSRSRQPSLDVAPPPSARRRR
jgi:copper homeostasis protein